jgi:hypothetical protein
LESFQNFNVGGGSSAPELYKNIWKPKEVNHCRKGATIQESEVSSCLHFSYKNGCGGP